jgi:hypothetical protein
MDGTKHTLESNDDEWLALVRHALANALTEPGAPVLDIEWLLGRCEDTAKMSDHWRDASMRQLRKDLHDFNAEFPGILPPHFLCEL